MATLADWVVVIDRESNELPRRVLAIVERRAKEAVGRMRGPAHFVPYYGRGTADRARPELQTRSGVHQAGLSWHLSHVGQSDIRVTFGGRIATNELGATIRPVKADKLAFPVGPALYPSGVRKYPGGVREAKKDWDVYALPTVIKGRLKGQKGPYNTVLFLRRDVVKIPPRPVIQPEVAVAAEAIADDLRQLMGTI